MSAIAAGGGAALARLPVVGGDMPGHLFIVQGDLTKLACDAWLLPTGRSLQIRNIWLENAPSTLLQLVTGSDDAVQNLPSSRETWYFQNLVETPNGWHDRSVQSFDLSEWHTEGDVARPWPTQIVVGLDWTADQKARRVADGARDFVRRAAKALHGRTPAYGRHRHLLALPVVGTGHGGGWESAGAILRQLIGVLCEELDRIDTDVALVTFTSDQLAAAQNARRQIIKSIGGTDHWQALTPALKEAGDRLADRSSLGKLVLFVGAGVSNSAGLPTWQRLLDGLAEDAGFGAAERRALAELPVLDQARLIQDRLEYAPSERLQHITLSDAICGRVKADRYGLAHALLASLPVSEVVTTNYDTLFERASHDAGFTAAILPYESTEHARRWLLKMHGCVDHPEDIVLTREDFLRYAERRGALAAIVQALLITHHMLFVGFSLQDDNFLRIADEVRKVMRGRARGLTASRDAFGTALLLNSPPLFASLWKDDIACVSIDGGAAYAAGLASFSAAANKFEILLDYVLFNTNQKIGHLLDDRYTDLLSEDELRLKECLVALQKGVGPEIRSLPAWSMVEELLVKLGGATSRASHS